VHRIKASIPRQQDNTLLQQEHLLRRPKHLPRVPLIIEKVNWVSRVC